MGKILPMYTSIKRLGTRDPSEALDRKKLKSVFRTKFLSHFIFVLAFGGGAILTIYFWGLALHATLYDNYPGANRMPIWAIGLFFIIFTVPLSGVGIYFLRSILRDTLREIIRSSHNFTIATGQVIWTIAQYRMDYRGLNAIYAGIRFKDNHDMTYDIVEPWLVYEDERFFPLKLDIRSRIVWHYILIPYEHF